MIPALHLQQRLSAEANGEPLIKAATRTGMCLVLFRLVCGASEHQQPLSWVPAARGVAVRNKLCPDHDHSGVHDSNAQAAPFFLREAASY